LSTLLSEKNYVQEQHIQSPKETENSLSGNIVSVVTDIASGIGSLFDIHPSNQDENEAEYSRQQALKKKKKPQQRRGIRR
jgi:hypothetical protein